MNRLIIAIQSTILTTFVLHPVYVPFLVSHRGFHSVHDLSDVRPLENSLMAYEAAWSSGIHLCECDIRLTKDERIILAHDDNFARLGKMQLAFCSHLSN